MAEHSGKDVTVLFTDVERSTDLRTELGDDAAHPILRRLEDTLREHVSRHGGREIKHTGDGFLIAFDSARKAVTSAIAVQRAIHELNCSLPKPVRVRIGINAGAVVEESGDVFGAAVNAAARIVAKAGGGRIFVSSEVKDAAGGFRDAEFIDRGMFWLKGFPERWRLYEIAWWEQDAANPPTLARERAAYVGRETERADLRSYLDRALGGRGALVLIAGEPGVGKTRMTAEIGVEARDRGALALVGRCYEMEGSPPYIPFVEILEDALRRVAPEAMREALGDGAAEVARLVPEVRLAFPDIAEPLQLPASQERRYLFRSVRELIERAGRMQPLVLVLDDLQWAEESTLLLLEHVAQHVGDMPVLVLGTYRDTELHGAHPLAKTLESLLRHHEAHRIRLRRLSHSGVGALLASLCAREPPEQLVRVVFDETEGNPFFVEEVFKYLVEERRLFDESGEWRADVRIGELDVPESVRLVLDRRLLRLRDTTHRVLTAAAVVGRAFDFELLQALAEVDEDALFDAIEEAEQAQLVTSASEGTDLRFTFSHELIRQTILSGISGIRRHRLHRRVADAMEVVHASRIDEYAADIAHHLLQASQPPDPTRVARYLAVAGERALGAAAFEDAERHFQTGVERLDPDDAGTRARLLVGLGTARRNRGHLEAALGPWTTAIDLHVAAGNVAGAAGLCREVANTLVWLGRYSDGRDVVERGLLTVGTRPTVDRGRLLAVGAYNCSHAGEFDEAERQFGEALALASELGDDRLLADCLHFKAQHHYSFMQPGPALEAASRATPVLRSLGALWDSATVLGYLQWSLFPHPGRLDEALRISAELEPLATQVGNVAALLVGLRNRAVLDFARSADLERLRRSALRDIDLCQDSGIALAGYSYTWLGLVEFWSGDWEAAGRHFREAVGLDSAGALAPRHEGFLFRHLALGGRSDEAVDQLERVREALPRPGRPNSIGSWTLLLTAVEGLIALGRREEAADLYPAVLEAIGTGTRWRLFDCRLLEVVAGMAAAAGGRWDEAEAHFEPALRQAAEYPVLIEQAEARRFFAATLVERNRAGDRERARELLGEAEQAYLRIGMPRHADLTEAMLRDI